MIELEGSRDELVAAGVGQLCIGLVAVGIAAVWPPVTVGLALASCVGGSLGAWMGYFLLRHANQRFASSPSGALVSDERGEFTVSPVTALPGLVALTVGAIVAEGVADGATGVGPHLCGSTVRGCSTDPSGQFLFLAIGLVAIPTVSALSYIIRSRGGHSE